MVCPKCKKIIPENSISCEYCGEVINKADAAQTVPAAGPVSNGTPKKKNTYKKVTWIIAGIFIAVILFVAIPSVTRERTDDFKNSYFNGITYATVGELVEASVKNPKWYASAWYPPERPKESNPALCCDGKIRGVDVHLVFGKYEEGGNVYLIYNSSEINGKTMTQSDAQMVLQTFVADYNS